MLQVGSDELRVAARRLRADAAEELRAASARLRVPEQRFGVEAAFDSYTTAAAYRGFTSALEQEFQLLEQAARDLADALEKTADAYDAADRRSALRLGRTI